VGKTVLGSCNFTGFSSSQYNLFTLCVLIIVMCTSMASPSGDVVDCNEDWVWAARGWTGEFRTFFI